MVIEMARFSPALKYRPVSPPVKFSAAAITTVASTPDSTLIRTGVPRLAESTPKYRGPAPSAHATACARLSPSAQDTPLVNSATISPTAASQPTTAPNPVSATLPSGLTCPPYTVNTALQASTNPPRLLTCAPGSTSSTPAIGAATIRNDISPERSTPSGMARLGFSISSAAELDTSNPTKVKTITGTRAMKPRYVGRKSDQCSSWVPRATP